MARRPHHRDADEPTTGTPDLGALLGREFSTAVVMFHEAVAARLGMTATENKALDLLARRGPLTAGDLAKELALTPGAITGLVDRLARAGYAQRIPDTADRRRILIVVAAEQLNAQMEPVFAPLQHAIGQLLDHYRDDERAAIAHFVTNVARILRDHTARVTATPTPAPRDRPTRAENGSR
jgi:DNA-binding MarR family transcriptional regulator